MSLRPARSAGGEAMSATIALAGRDRRRRPQRGAGCAATGWPALGAAIILAWILVAMLAPLAHAATTRTSSTSRDAPAAAVGRRTGSAPTRSAATCSTRVLYGARISLTVGIVVVLVGAAVRHAARRHRGLCARLGRGGADAAHRPGVLLSADHPGDGDRRRARHRHGQHHHRHAGGVVAEIRPARAQPGDRRSARRNTSRRRSRSASARRTSCCARSSRTPSGR